jgi:hypothetical protein
MAPRGLPGLLPSDLTPEARDRLTGLLLEAMATGEPGDGLVALCVRVLGLPPADVRAALRLLGRGRAPAGRPA